MRILQAIHDFLPNHQAGSELYCCHLSQALQSLGHDVRLFYSEIDHGQPAYSVRRGEFDGLPYWEIVNNHGYSRFEETYENPSIERVFAECLDEFQPDVVHFHHLLGLSYGCARLCKERRIPVVFTLHDYWLTCPRGGGQRFRGEGLVCLDVDAALCAECISRYSLGVSRGARWIKKIVSWFEKKQDGDLLPLMQKGAITTPKRAFVTRGVCSIDGDCRESMYAHPPSSIAIRCDIAEDTDLTFAIALHPDVYEKEGGGVRFIIRRRDDVIYDRVLHPKQKIEDRGWKTERLSLTNFVGKRIDLVFETQAFPSGQIDFCTACWAAPRLISRNPPPYQPSATSIVQNRAQQFFARRLRKSLISKVERRAQKTRELFDWVDLFIAPSHFLRGKFIEYGLDPQKIVFSDYGIGTCGYENSPRKVEMPVRFTYIGTLVAHKGLHVLIDAFNRLPNDSAILSVYGNTAEFTDYVNRIRAAIAHPGIRLCGRAENGDIPAILAQTDVLVVPSIWFENSPITIHEAFLAKVPVITSRFGGMADLVLDGENGFLFERGNAQSLYDCLLHCVENPESLDAVRPRPDEVKTIQADAEWMAGRYRELLKK